MTMTPHRLGILGGSSDQATAAYYDKLNRAVNQRLGGWTTADLVVTSMNFAFSERVVRTGAWAEMGEYLADRARVLEFGGAGLFLCVSNTLHRVADVFCAAVEIPFLHIVDPTAAAIRRGGLKRVALLGTRPVMSAPYMKDRYREKFGIEIDVPSEADQALVDRIIFDELCRGVLTEDSRQAYLAIIDGLMDRGAEGVILGCTEIPLLIEQRHRPAVPFFDTMSLHVEAAAEWACTPGG